VAEETNEFSLGYSERDVVEHGRTFAVAREHHVDVLGLQLGFCH
jgi:hypothetical protein